MTHISRGNSNLPRNPQDDAGAGIVGFAVLGLLIWLGTSVAAVFAASTVAGAASLVVIAVSLILAVPTCERHGVLSLASALMLLTALWGALFGTVVFEHHWLAFTPAAWVLNGLFLAALVSGAWAAANSLLKFLAALMALSLVAATLVLPRPPGGEGPLDTARQWTVRVEVLDENQQPLEGAMVLCSAVMSWHKDLGLSQTAARITDREGRAPEWEFNEDPRLKVVVCNAWKPASEGNADYPLKTQVIVSPQGGGEYDLKFTLVENPHPDVGYLGIDVAGDYEQFWYDLQFELWPNEPSGYFGSRSGPQPLMRKSWSELRGSGFAVPAHLAGTPLWLRHLYEGPPLDSPISNAPISPYSEVRARYVGAVPAGTRKRVLLVIPEQTKGD